MKWHDALHVNYSCKDKWESVLFSIYITINTEIWVCARYCVKKYTYLTHLPFPQTLGVMRPDAHATSGDTEAQKG